MKIPPSTYYYRPRAGDGERRKWLLRKIEEIVLEFPRYGYRRVTHELRRRGVGVNHKVVLREMRDHGLLCKRKRSFVVRTTDSGHAYPVYPNLAKGRVPAGLNELWVSDITYIWLAAGFAYVAVILDAFSRKAVGWAISGSLHRSLAIAALRMAIARRRPAPGCIHHSDRGVQYAAHEYVDLLKEHRFWVSMSAKGNPYDNAMAESFMKTLKYDEVYLGEYKTLLDVRRNVPAFLEEVYNEKRLHSSIGYQSPNEFERRWLNEHPPAQAQAA